MLILGRFTDERKAVLDALREELRKRDYLPILFDFDVPATRDITETVSLLARMARFIIADLTDPSSIPKELEAIVPHLAVPVQPLLEGSSRPYAMFKDYWKYDWVLPVYRYEGLEPLLATLAEKVIAPAEGKVKALARATAHDRGGTDQASIARHEHMGTIGFGKPNLFHQTRGGVAVPLPDNSTGPLGGVSKPHLFCRSPGALRKIVYVIRAEWNRGHRAA